MSVPLGINLILSLTGLFLSSWIVLPAPIFQLLPLAVGAPEISPLLLLSNGVILGFGFLQQPHWSRFLAITCSVVGCLLSSLPILQLAPTVRQAERMMYTTLGREYLEQISPDQKAAFRSQPFVVKDFLTGVPLEAIQPQRQFYLSLDGTSLPLAIYQPATPPPHPVIVTIYGGAWQRGNPDQHATACQYWVRQGYGVVAISYRHAPPRQFPTQLQDVQSALQWVVDQASRLELDKTRIAVMGWSAGGHLALLAAYHPKTIPLRAVVSYYAPTNLVAGYEDPPFPDPIDSKAVLEAFLGGSPSSLRQQYEQASPLYQVKPGLPPTLLIYGQRDHVVKSGYGQQLYQQLQNAGNTAVWLPLPWADHAFDAVFQGLGNQIALYYTERFLAWALRPEGVN